MDNQQKSYLLAFISVILWSTVSTAFEISLIELDVIQLLFVATFVSVIISFAYIVFSGRLKLLSKTSGKDMFKSALVALLNPFGYYLVLFKAYDLLPAQVAQPLNYTWPIILVLLSAPMLNQKLSFKIMLSLIISFSGTIIISTQGNLKFLQIESKFGVFLAVFSSFFWALFWIINIKDKRDELIKLFLAFSFALIYEIIFVWLFSDFLFFNSKSVYAAIYVGIFEMGITFIIWLKALKLTSETNKISNIIFLSPIFALFFIHFILKEKIFYTTYVGLFFILTGIFIVNRKK